MMDEYCFLYLYIFLCTPWHKFIVLKTFFFKFTIVHKAHKSVKLLKGKKWPCLTAVRQKYTSRSHHTWHDGAAASTRKHGSQKPCLLQIPHNNKPCYCGFSPP